MSGAAHTLAEQGVDEFNRWRRTALATLDQAVAADPDCALAHAVKGLALVGGRNDRFRPMVQDCVAAARRCADTDRERMLTTALTALAAGRVDWAAVTLEDWLVEHPTDLLAHRLLQQELFWIGEAAWMRDVAARARPAWSDALPDYGVFLSVYAFSHEEAGQHEIAEKAGREAVERDPSDYWGSHAVAHVLEMQHRAHEGMAWLEGLAGNWGEANQIGHHLWWHLCLFCLELGEHGKILSLLDSQVRNPDSPLVQAVPDAYIDIQNVVSLLVRLELRGVEVGDRWQAIAEPAAGRIDNHPNPFTSAHAALALAAAGRFDEADRLVASLAEFAAEPGPLGPKIQAAAWPAAAAAVAHRRGDYAETMALLMPARRSLWQMGGSHAQRDVFTQLLADACRRQGKHDYLKILLDELSQAGFANPTGRSFYADLGVSTRV